MNGEAGGEPRSLLIATGQAILRQGWGMMMAGNFSVATLETLNKIVRTCRSLRHAVGREPTPEEIAVRLRMPPETIRKLLGTRPPLANPTLNEHPALTI